MKKMKWMVGIISLSFVMGFTACSIPAGKDNEASAETISEVSQGNDTDKQAKDDIIVWGEVSYTDSQEINIDFPSIVDTVDDKEGQAVKKGDALITLNKSEYKQTIEKLENSVSLNQVILKDVTQDASAVITEITQLKEDIARKTKQYNDGSKADLQILENSLTRINKEVTDAKKDYERQKQLFEIGSVPQKILDDYADLVDKKEKAKADIGNNIKKTKEALQDELDVLGTSLKYKEIQLEKMNTSNEVNTDKQGINVSMAQLDLNIMKTKLEKEYLADNKVICNIQNGTVKNIYVIRGSALGKQNTPQKVMELIDADTIVVRAEVPEEFGMQIKEGDSAEIIPKTDKSKKIAGTVIQVSRIAVEKDGERIIKVEVKPDDKEGVLKAGCSTDVIFGAK
jgi:multidrug resistance efflux pump